MGDGISRDGLATTADATRSPVAIHIALFALSRGGVGVVGGAAAIVVLH